MNAFVTLKIALRAILRNKMRSFLTTLGIIIGVAAVIAMMAIGAGAKAQVEQAFAAMGTNLLIVLPGSTTAGG
jgi:putative ABC transport system permease protein